MDARFCDSCGTPLDADQAPADIRSRTPAELAAKMLAERSRVEGERRTVTILFADAKGFTPFSEARDAEAVYTITQGCIERMLEAVHRHEGTVNQFTGDGIMAIFGAPIAHEDSARRAVSAAIEMQAALKRYLADAGLDVSFRVGLNTGPVVVGRISDNLEMDYTAIGDTVNLAARMEQMAEPGSVYITEQTYRQVSDYFDVDDLGALEVKGKTEAVHVYKVTAARGVRTRIDAAVARGLSPFVGRDPDLAVLHGLWQQALEGRGQIVMISGEPGIGKSRLLLEFHRSLPTDVIWREAHCVSYGENIPYLPVIDLVKSGFGISDSDDDGAIISKIDGDASEWSPEAQKTVPYLKFLLQVDPGDALIDMLDPQERRAGILAALRALILERSRVAPRIVVIEDLHWADDQSEDAFRACADAVATAKVLMVLTFRPGYMHPAGELPNAHRIALSSLDSGAQRELANATLTASSLPTDLAAAVAQKAEGNPLFIEEVSKALAAGAADANAVPNSLQDVILARIDRLEAEARSALQLASVIGREFTLRLLTRISDLESQLEGALRELKSLELIYEKSFFPELAYMFKHALTHDVAYSTLLLERRKSLHRVVAFAIEDLYADRIAEHYETLAYHFEQAEIWDRALDYILRSADKAATAFAMRDAVLFYDRALSICETTRNDAQVAEISHRRALVNMATFALDEALADFERMLGAGERIGDRHVIAQATAGRSVVEFFFHEFAKSEASALSALEIADGDFDDVSFTATIALASVYFVTDRLDEGAVRHEEAARFVSAAREPILDWLTGEFSVLRANWTGDFDAAVAAFEEEMARLAPQGAIATIPTGWAGAVALGGAGQYERAIEVGLETIANCERMNVFPDFHARTLNTLGWIHGEIGDFDTAIEWNTKGLEAAREIPSVDPEFENNAVLNLADCYAALGDLDRADELYQSVLHVIRDPKPTDLWMLWRYAQHTFHSLGEVALKRGDIDAALGYADECLAGARRSTSRKNLVKGLRLRSSALLAVGNIDRARSSIDEAIAIARQIKNPPQLWRTLAAVGALEAETGGDPSDAYAEAEDVVGRVAATIANDRLRKALAAVGSRLRTAATG